jgi:archaeosortase A (PGF-CTERM-specific)
MVPGPVALLDSLGVVTVPLGWLVLALFVAGAVVERSDRGYARPVLVVAWGLFGLFWLSVIHYFAVDQRSIVEGLGSVLAAPLSVYVGYVLAKGRDSLFVLSRAVAIMGLVYVPVIMLDPLRQPLVEAVTVQTELLINALGFHPEVVDGLTVQGLDGETYRISEKQYPYESTFVFFGEADPLPITYTIATACTGIGSMAIFAGLVGAVPAPLGRKLRAFAVSLPVIYALNLVRNVFIAITFGTQMTHVFPDAVIGLFSLESEYMVSYMVSDRILAQGGSVVALVVITWFVVRQLPEVLVVIEDLAYLATGREYDLAAALDVEDTEAVPGD